MKTYYLLLIFVMLTLQSCGVKQPVQMSGNPLFEGWYADPEGIILNLSLTHISEPTRP